MIFRIIIYQLKKCEVVFNSLSRYRNDVDLKIQDLIFLKNPENSDHLNNNNLDENDDIYMNDLIFLCANANQRLNAVANYLVQNERNLYYQNLIDICTRTNKMRFSVSDYLNPDEKKINI